MYQYHAIVDRVVDGDTVDLRIDLGFKVWIEERCRLLDVDTPETRTRDKREKKFGKMAAARVEELLPLGSKQTINTRFDSRGKFGRAMVDFQLEGGKTLCELLISEHLAVRYKGENKKDVRKLHERNWQILEEKEA